MTVWLVMFCSRSNEKKKQFSFEAKMLADAVKQDIFLI